MDGSDPGGSRGGEIAVSLVRGGERRPAVLHWRHVHDGPRSTVTVELAGAGPPLHAAGPDAFDALAGVREQLEPSGWRLAVQGARRDTYPSGMARDMGGGFSVYVLRIGQPPGREDLVRTFDEADPALLATVAEQEEHWRRWRDALVRRAPGSG